MNQPTPEGATTIDEVRQALEALSNDELHRLFKAARGFMGGTDYSSPHDLLNEAVMRTLRAANGERGRHWPRGVDFMAFLIKTMQGLADDSLHSSQVERTVEMEALSPSGLTAEDALGAHGHAHADVVTLAIAAGERADAQDRAQVDLAKIDTYFAADEEVGWLLMGHKDGLTATEIREISGMTQTQYETARRRFRRGLDKLFPGRSQK